MWLKIKKMKKNKLSSSQRKSVLNRAKKRSDRLKKTKAHKHVLTAIALQEKKLEEKRQNEKIEKLINSRKLID